MKRALVLLLLVGAQRLDAQTRAPRVFADSAADLRYAIADTTEVITRTPLTSLDYLKKAIVLFARNQDEAGAEMYFRGIAAWEDSASAAAYVDDALIVGTDQEVISLTDGSLSKRANSLKLYWKKRAVRDGVSIPTRIGDHYRRIAFARTNFRLTAAHPPASRWVLVRRDGVAKELDDRGVVYVRFGKPVNRLALTSQLTGKDVWLYYDTEGHKLIFWFNMGRIEPDALAKSPYVVKASMERDTSVVDRLQDYATFDPRYAFMSARLQTIHTYEISLMNPLQKAIAINDRLEDMYRLNDRITQEHAERMGHAIGMDQARPAFLKPLPTYHDFATFRGNGCTDIVYSIMAQAPAYELSVAVADTFTWETEAVETRVARGTPADGYLRSTGVFCTQPRNNAYMRFTVKADDNRGVTEGGEIRIADYRGNHLMMSDLLFATTAPGPFIRGKAHLAIIPPRQFVEGEAFRVFYELYNLPRGARYRTDITFKTIESGVFTKVFKGHKKTTVSFEDEAVTDDLVQELRTLVPQVEPGKVEVTISVTNLATQQKATSKENIYILAKEK